LLWHRVEEAPRLLVGEREQCEFLASIERGDDPHRPAAELSTAGVEQNRARQLMGGHPGAHVRDHFQKTMPFLSTPTCG
jgi:hypothetical protein